LPTPALSAVPVRDVFHRCWWNRLEPGDYLEGLRESRHALIRVGQAQRETGRRCGSTQECRSGWEPLSLCLRCIITDTAWLGDSGHCLAWPVTHTAAKTAEYKKLIIRNSHQLACDCDSRKGLSASSFFIVALMPLNTVIYVQSCNSPKPTRES
jgi:hypothetical protein